MKKKYYYPNPTRKGKKPKPRIRTAVNPWTELLALWGQALEFLQIASRTFAREVFADYMGFDSYAEMREEMRSG